jgi:serine/threonine protein kinase
MDSEKDNATKPIDLVATQMDASPFENSFVPGALFNDRYLIEKELGRGGVGITYLARDNQLYSMPVVIKILIEKPGNGEWIKRKFIQETEALTRISHPGVVKVLNRGEFEGGKQFFVMEFVEGYPLRSAIAPTGMDFERAAHILQSLGNALHAAHEKKIIHRDLKPENVMLQALGDGEEAIKIIDFGIARVNDSQVGETTDANIIAGSLNYIAPEQLLSKHISEATDIYAIGVIAYEMLTGRRPFNPDAANLLAAMRQLLTLQQEGSIVNPQQLRPSLPQATQKILLRALAFEPQNRPQDARKFCEELAKSLTEHAEEFPPNWQKSPKTSVMGAMDTGPIGVRKDTKPPYEAGVVNQDESSATAAQAQTIAQSSSAEATNPEVIKIESETIEKRSVHPLLLVGAVLLIAMVGVIVWQILTPKPKPIVQEVLPPKAEIKLSYFLTVQRDPQRFQGSKPFQLEREMIFGDGDLVRFTFVAPQDGYLYIFNESPSAGAGQFAILFPTPTTNQGSSKLIAAQQIQVPEKWFKLVKDEGTEKLWIVWTAHSLENLEALKKWANPNDLGEIKDSRQVAELKTLLASQANNPPTLEKDESQKQTTLKTQNDVLVKMIALEHR